MSRGLGRVQRALLLALARLEVAAAEDAARNHTEHDPPTFQRVYDVVFAAAYHELYELVDPALDADMKQYPYQPYEYDENLHYVVSLEDLNQEYLRDCRERALFERLLTPSRALILLQRRGFVERTMRQVVVTDTGFIYARKKLGLPDSTIVDLDQVAEQLAGFFSYRKPPRARFKPKA